MFGNKFRIAFAFSAFGGFAAALYYVFLRFSKPAGPRLSGDIKRAAILVGSRQRTFCYYAPADLPPHAPLLIALHGSGETGEDFRRHTGHGFEMLAEEEKFVVVFPDGYQRHWNDCRRKASYSARRKNIEDVQFIETLIDYFAENLDINRRHVFATGHSNGAQMCFRLALEFGDQIAAIAAISANLPVPSNLECNPVGKPISVLIMNGTRDPINPYYGGEVKIFGFGNRGFVHSSEETARYFAGLAGIKQDPEVELLREKDESYWTERSTWRNNKRIEVELYKIFRGGHVVPQPYSRYPLVLGRTSEEFDGTREIWNFFKRQLSP